MVNRECLLAMCSLLKSTNMMKMKQLKMSVSQKDHGWRQEVMRELTASLSKV